MNWQRTPFAIGNFLRGWVINVPDNHDMANDADNILNGFKGTVQEKLGDELKGVKFQLELEAELTKQKADGEDVIATARLSQQTTTLRSDFHRK